MFCVPHFRRLPLFSLYILVPSLNLKTPRSIILEQPTSVIKSATNADDLVTATKLALQNLEPVVEMDGAKYYADLISLFKVAQKEDILNAYEQIKNGGPDSSEMAQYVDELQLKYHLNIINGYCELLITFLVVGIRSLML